MLNKEDLDSIEKAKIFFQKEQYNQALKISTLLVKKHKDDYFLQNMHGFILLSLKNYKIKLLHHDYCIECVCIFL